MVSDESDPLIVRNAMTYYAFRNLITANVRSQEGQYDEGSEGRFYFHLFNNSGAGISWHPDSDREAVGSKRWFQVSSLVRRPFEFLALSH